MENRHRACRTLRELPGRVAALPGARCARRSRRSTPSPAPPTTSPTKATPARASGSPRWPRTAPTLAADGGAAGRPRAGRRCSSPLRAAIARHRLPVELLDALLDAFVQDVTVHRYADRPALLDYCRRSANPVGRLLLHLYGVGGADALARSDAICTALQLANFWQDLGVDTRRGRLYLPESGLPPPRRRSARPARRQGQRGGRIALVAEAVAWARELMLSRRAAGPRGAGPRRLGAAARGPGRAAHPRAHRPARRRDPAAATEARLRRDAPAIALAGAGDAPREGRGERARRVMRTTSPGRAPMTPEQYVQDKAAASGSSFYYAFLFLPPPRRAAITAFYAFCREVDDVVDEVSDPGVAAAKLAWWQSEVAAQLGRQAEPSGDARAAAAHRRLRHRAAAPAGGDRRLPDGPRPVALPRLPRPGALLRPGRRRRRRGRGQHLRPGERVDRRLCAPARAGDAAHQHHPRRRRRRPPRPHLPADGRAEAVRRQGAASCWSAATATASRR